eukprot:s1031_g32.t1
MAAPRFKQGRPTDVHVQEPSVALKVRQVQKQARRLQTLERLLRKALSPCPADAIQEAHRVWRSVVSSAGFSRSFAHWAVTQAHLTWSDCASVAQVVVLKDTVMQFAQACASHAWKRKRLLFNEQVERSWQAENGSLPYRLVKDPQKPPVTDLIIQLLIRLSPQSWNRVGKSWLKVSNPQDFPDQCELLGIGSPCRVVGRANNAIQVNRLVSRKEAASLYRESVSADPALWSEHFLQQWGEYWNRDTVDQDSIDQVLATLPDIPAMEVPLLSLADWKQALRTAKRRTMRGAEGWSVQELLWLPDHFIESLLQISRKAGCCTVLCLTYADNWELVARSARELVAGYRLLNILVSPGKCWFWAICPPGRRTQKRAQLFHQFVPVKLQARELGADISYCLRKAAAERNLRFFWGQADGQASWALFPSLTAVLPEYVTAFGLLPEPTGWRLWHAQLDTLSLPVIARSVDASPQLFYTDRACLHPRSASIRVAAGAVLRAKEAGTFDIIWCGILPGSCQTIFRAELLSVACAFYRSSKPVLFTDAKGVARIASFSGCGGFHDGPLAQTPVVIGPVELIGPCSVPLIPREAAPTVCRQGFARLLTNWIREIRGAPSGSAEGFNGRVSLSPHSLQGLATQFAFCPRLSSLREMIAWQWDVSLGPELLMVGDSPSNDIAFGKAAGVSTALVDPEGWHRQGQSTMGADFVVDSLAELPRILWQHFHIEGPCVAKRPPPIPANAACHAAAQGDVSALTGMDLKDLAASDETGNTPLIWAADSGNLDAVELLLSAGVDDSAKGFLGNSALSRACRRGHESILRLLLARSTKVIDAPNDKLQTPLHFAAFYQHPRAVQLLLDVGASTTVVDCKGRTPAEACDAEVAAGSWKEIQGMILQARRTGQIAPPRPLL